MKYKNKMLQILYHIKLYSLLKLTAKPMSAV